MYRLYLIIAFGALGLIPVLRKWRFPLYILPVYYVCRLTIVWLLFSHGAVGNDIRGWLEHGVRMVGGDFPGVDFISPYGILFNGILYGCAFIWENPFSIVLGFAVFEIAGIMLFWNIMEKWECLQKYRSQVMWLYVTSPIVMMNVGWDVQDEGVRLFFVALCCWLFQIGKKDAIPYCAVLGILSTKLLALIYFMPFFLVLKFKHAIRFSVLLCAVWGMELLCGISPFDLRFERLTGSFDEISNMITANNVWYFVDKVWPDVPYKVYDIFFVAVLMIVLVHGFTLTCVENECSRQNILYRLLSLVGIVLMLFFKMTPSCYFLPLLLPFCITIVVCGGSTHRVLLVVGAIASMRFVWEFIYPEHGLDISTLVLVTILGIALADYVVKMHKDGARWSQLPTALRRMFCR